MWLVVFEWHLHVEQAVASRSQMVLVDGGHACGWYARAIGRGWRARHGAERPRAPQSRTARRSSRIAASVPFAQPRASSLSTRVDPASEQSRTSSLTPSRPSAVISLLSCDNRMVAVTCRRGGTLGYPGPRGLGLSRMARAESAVFSSFALHPAR